MLTSRNEAQKLNGLSNSLSLSRKESADKEFQPKSINQVIAEYSDTKEGGGVVQTFETQLKNHDRQLSFGALDHAETDYGIRNNYLP